MSVTNIACPKCGAEIPLTEAVSHRLREQLAAEFDQQRQEQNGAMAARERKLEAEKKKLDDREKSVGEQIARQVEAERKKLAAEAARTAEERVSTDLKDLRNQLAEQQAKLKATQDAELELRKQKREIEQSRENLKLEVARQLDNERSKIADTARQQAVEGERLKQADKDNKIHELQKQIEILQQKAQQGSMQAQGETLELTLEQDLRQAFVYDEILEIKKGERGADLRQNVRTNNGTVCGSILWESKRAKNWAKDWLPKLKEDQCAAKAELAVLVATCPPENIRGIGQLDGVWVCEPPFACALAAALRQGLVRTTVQKSQDTGRADKMTQLYNYVCSVEFIQRIQGIVESYVGLQKQLAVEKNAFSKQWEEREKQITKAINHAAGLYGSIHGITGPGCLPEIQSLQLPGASQEPT